MPGIATTAALGVARKRTAPPQRCVKERIIQTLSYEAGGLVLVTPFYALAFGHTAIDSLTLMFVLSLLVMAWSPLHNVVFDWFDGRVSGRVASDRPHHLRLLHAFSLETSSILVTLPVVMLLGGHGFWTALAIDVGLTVSYAAYAYVFHLGFDRMRPINKLLPVSGQPGKDLHPEV